MRAEERDVPAEVELDDVRRIVARAVRDESDDRAGEPAEPPPVTERPDGVHSPAGRVLLSPLPAT
jgi:hypothetical protein